MVSDPWDCKLFSSLKGTLKKSIMCIYFDLQIKEMEMAVAYFIVFNNLVSVFHHKKLFALFPAANTAALNYSILKLKLPSGFMD